MALIPHPVPGKAKSEMICKAFSRGAPLAADGHVFYGVSDGNFDDWHQVLARRQPFWFIDNSYFDVVRGQQFRVTKGRLQHRGTGHTDGYRLSQLGVEVKDSKLGGDYVLAVEQSPMFMQLIARDTKWLQRALAHSVVTGTPIKMRKWVRDKAMAAQTLAEDLRGAALVVTHSSAAAVEAALAGIPTATAWESAACGAHSSTPISLRTQWAAVLADNQFTIDEMKDGTAWSMLHKN